MHFEQPTEEFQYPNLVETVNFFYFQGYEGFQDSKMYCWPPFLNEAASIAASIAASKLHYQAKMLWASSNNGKMMLEVILETWVEKIRQNMFPLLGKHKILIKTWKK